MATHEQRITLIARSATEPRVHWSCTHSSTGRLAFLDSANAVRFALGVAINDVALDVERVIIDRAGTADEILSLLAALPGEFSGDVLIIREDGAGFLSATGRGGDRVFYALTARDIGFYLETNDLVMERVTPAAAPFRAVA